MFKSGLLQLSLAILTAGPVFAQMTAPAARTSKTGAVGVTKIEPRATRPSHNLY